MPLCHHCSNPACCLDNVPIFTGLDSSERAEIAAIASTRQYAKGEIIYSAGDKGGTLFVLYTGRVKLFRINISGREQVLRLIEPGDFIGELSLFSALPFTDNAIALTATTMCVLQGDKFKQLMARFPSLTFKVMDELSRRLEQAENRIEDISLNSVIRRTVNALLDLAEQSDEFLLPLTKGDLASQLGMTQETLSRQLSNLQAEGLIALEGQRKIIIKDRASLIRIGQFDL